jgi:uncharacterized protein YfeS
VFRFNVTFGLFVSTCCRQEAILAAISEKDAHIALLEMAPNKKTENIEEVEKLSREKLRLQQMLKDLVSFKRTSIQVSWQLISF